MSPNVRHLFLSQPFIPQEIISNTQVSSIINLLFLSLYYFLKLQADCFIQFVLHVFLNLTSIIYMIWVYQLTQEQRHVRLTQIHIKWDHEIISKYIFSQNLSTQCQTVVRYCHLKFMQNADPVFCRPNLAALFFNQTV